MQLPNQPAPVIDMPDEIDLEAIMNKTQEKIMQTAEAAITPPVQYENIKEAFSLVSLDQVREIAGILGVDISDLRRDLNVGMQKMQACNRIRMYLNASECPLQELSDAIKAL
jgi:hypothetical protein